ncbi:Aste57867_23964 [Aphanomyces stellatus]|uniref:Aste57867_23964 protein n=1 Tax=Aphanomyces stellatus TaxID=120398 RepID=A0A485LP78_9STRA|nr:hypothetical protein As57867_023891 [Aphanomyces stellatus]VFU00607.1 Aste57867_23964 [Aphanomyces stellatus]
MAKVASEQSIAAHHMDPASSRDIASDGVMAVTGDEDDDDDEEDQDAVPTTTGADYPTDGSTSGGSGSNKGSSISRMEALRKQSSYKNENPWNRPRTGKKISFVDETDTPAPLHEITYSKSTHYSRTAQAQAAPPPAGGCCVLQ